MFVFCLFFSFIKFSIDFLNDSKLLLSSTEQFLQKFQQGVQELRSLETKLLCPNEVLPPLYFSGSHDVLSLDNMPSKIKQAKQDVIFDEANTLQREEAKVRRDSVAATLPSGKCTPMNWQQKGRNYNSEMMNNPNWRVPTTATPAKISAGCGNNAHATHVPRMTPQQCTSIQAAFKGLRRRRISISSRANTSLPRCTRAG